VAIVAHTCALSVPALVPVPVRMCPFATRARVYSGLWLWVYRVMLVQCRGGFGLYGDAVGYRDV